MFNLKMSSYEMLEEYRADVQDVLFQAERFDCSEFVRKLLRRKRKEQLVVVDHIFKAKSGNRYLCLYFYLKSDNSPNFYWIMAEYIMFGLIDTAEGVYAIAFYLDVEQALLLTPHFFERYKERMFESVAPWQIRQQLILAKSTPEIMKVYFSENPSITWIETENVFHNRTHIFAPVNDGVALLQWDKKMQLLKANTFITESMLNENQLTMLGYARAFLDMPKSERDKYQAPDFLKVVSYNQSFKA